MMMVVVVKHQQKMKGNYAPGCDRPSVVLQRWRAFVTLRVAQTQQWE
jgi:hypothetical protein